MSITTTMLRWMNQNMVCPVYLWQTMMPSAPWIAALQGIREMAPQFPQRLLFLHRQ
jgi:hypothetical protein